MRFIYALFAICVVWTLEGQDIPCIKNSIDLGDQFNLKLDNLPEQINLGREGDGNLWTFSELTSPMTTNYKYVAASEGEYNHLFGDADIVLRDSWGSEVYYKTRSNQISRVGSISTEGGRSLEPVLKRYLKEQTACLDGIRDNQNIQVVSEYILESATEALRGTRVADTESYKRDAAGVLYLPTGVFDAFRVQKNSIQEHEEVVYIDGEWRALESNLLATKANKNVREYIFIEEGTSRLLAVAKVSNSDKATSVLYFTKDTGEDHSDHHGANHFTLYPNTTYGDIRLNFMNFEAGVYYLEINDVIGRKIWSQRYRLRGNSTLKEDLSFLPKGTYVYSLSDINRNKLVTRRLAIIEP